MKQVNKVIKKIKRYNPKFNDELVKEAFQFAKLHHSEQVRASGEAFIEHPVNVALILVELEMDEATIVAALLHDILEDTDVTREQLEDVFGQEIAELIEGVTKLSQIQFKSRRDHQAENLRKMLLAMAKDLRVILIKLADRLHNMRTLKFLEEDRRQRIAQETREIYAPLAHRLGIFQLKWQLEDLAFETLEPKKYAQITKMIDQKRAQRERYIKNAIQLMSKKLKKLKIKATVTGRVKHFYSIYQKMVHSGKDLNEIYDLLAIRIQVEETAGCYAVLGALHSIYTPVPGRFKDYIAVPKANMYQSLHTTLVGDEGRPLEVQIRTEEMHKIAELGIAAHWTYKEGIKGKKRDEQVSWLRQMLSQSESSDSGEFLDTLKSDLFEQEVFVFTPQGDVKSFPAGSTPIDFAYSVHTEVGHALIGAKVDHKIVPLEYKLQMGDMVEILTSKSAAGPSKDWLKLAKTSKARSRIRGYYSKEFRVDSVQVGKDELTKALRKYKVKFVMSKQAKLLGDLAHDQNFKSADDLFASIGQAQTSAKQLATKIVNELNSENGEPGKDEIIEGAKVAKKEIAAKTGVEVQGLDDVFVRLSRCCNPVPGDDIKGFITKGRGISVHRSDCSNIISIEKLTPDRLIDVNWNIKKAVNFQVEVEVEALDRAKLLKDVSTVISDSGVNIISANVGTTKDGFAVCRFLIEIGNIAHLDNILKNIKRVDAVFDAYRA